MPAVRRINKSIFSYKGSLQAVRSNIGPSDPKDAEVKLTAKTPEKEIIYPTTAIERAVYRTTEGKTLTSYQWEVYDFVRSIPSGCVTTYKDVCTCVGGSPRSVGNALRQNPFAPYIPCHRVIASNLFIGGFRGEWGPKHKTGIHCHAKRDLLAREGVAFTETGHLLSTDSVLWRVC
ncbi:hypothetical protein H2248_005668 [Termitomyces sp. 'cryptogamus']|nr:hypothetical protein H2248_005668 [Termitomyces sp. 'cryptogamus']